MIEMRMRQPDGVKRRTGSLDHVHEPRPFVTGIYKHGMATRLINDEVAVLLEGADGADVDLHIA
jgi:hypothetical protein